MIKSYEKSFESNFAKKNFFVSTYKEKCCIYFRP